MLIAAIMARSLLMSQKRLIFFLNLTVIVLQVSEASSHKCAVSSEDTSSSWST